MANKFLRDTTGSVLVEYTIVFPIFIVLILGTVDVTYMLYEWALANKAAYIGARIAIVSNPVASAVTTYASVTNPPYTATQVLQIGQPCFDTTNGATFTATGNCPASVNYVCTPAASLGVCTNGGVWSETAFTNTNGTGVFDRMITIFPRLARQNVQISYQTNGLGYVGGLSWTVTVSIQCMTHQFYFIDALMGWVFSGPSAGCPAGAAGPAIPAFASTLQSEDMVTN